jgi:hypothetical protein
MFARQFISIKTHICQAFRSGNTLLLTDFLMWGIHCSHTLSSLSCRLAATCMFHIRVSSVPNSSLKLTFVW